MDFLTTNSNDSRRILRFAEFSFDTEKRVLWRDGATISLAPKACELLGVLIENAPQVLSKEELMNLVWNDSFVEEANLTHHISALRKALGEDKNGRKFIETIPRKGYRFVAEEKNSAAAERAEIVISERASVQFVEETIFETNDLTEKEREFPAALAVAPNFALPSPTTSKKRRLILTFAAAGSILLIGAAAFFAYRNFGSAKTVEPKEISFKRLTPDADAISPSVSPDGASVVFSRDENGQEILWRKQIVSGELTQLLPATSVIPGRIIYTRFSPDGKWIYYSYVNDQGLTVYRIPANGGTPQKIISTIFTDFSISPDGKYLAYAFDFRQVLVADVETGETRVVAERDGSKLAFKGDDLDCVAWSPDGTKLISAGSIFEDGRNVQQLIEIDVKTGAERIIPTAKDFKKVWQIEMLADGSGVIVTQFGRIARVNLQTGEVENITNETDKFGYIRLSADSKTLVATQVIGHYNIWTAPADNIEKRRQITIGAAARQGTGGIAYLRDGKIVYTSTASGALDIWMMNEDGTAPRQLTINAGTSNDFPLPTRDGRYIVFLSNRSGTTQVWRMDVDGRNPAQLSQFKESWDFSLAPDNQVYYISYAPDGKSNQCYKVPVEGGESVKFDIPSFAYGAPQFSPDGKWIFYFNNVTTGEPISSGLVEAATGKVVRRFKGGLNYTRWSPDSKYIYFAHPAGQEFWRQPIEGEAQKLADLRPMKIAQYHFSADGKKIAFSLGSTTNEIVSIENFGGNKIE